MAARVMKPTAKTKVPVKAPGRLTASKKKEEKKIISSNVMKLPIKPKSTIIKLKKNSEPKNLHILITNNTKKSKAPIAQSVLKAKIVETKKPSKQAVSVISTSVLEKPAIQSPFRFPILTEKRLPIVARIAGFFLMFVGTFFSLLSAPASSDAMLTFIGSSQTAALTQTPATSTTNAATDAGFTDITPIPNIFIEGGPLLSGTVPITITVPQSSSVKVILDNRNSTQSIVLGSAQKVDENTWRIYWDTTKFNNAEYRIKVVVMNHDTTYDYTGLEVYDVRNNTPEISKDSETNANDIGAIASTSEDSPINESESSIKFTTSKTGIITKAMEFKVVVDNATRITIHAHNIKSRALYYVGLATNRNGNEWGLNWKSELLPDGEYDFFIRAIVNGKIVESSRVNLIIANHPVVPPPLATTTEEKPIAPIILLSLSETSPVSGFVYINVSTSPVDWVEFYSNSSNSFSTYFLGLATKLSETSWSYEWDTSQTPNGTYIIHSRVKTAFGFTESSRFEVVVRNQVMDAFTPEQEDVIDGLKNIASDLPSLSDGLDDVVDGSTIYVEPVDVFITRIQPDEGSRSNVSTILKQHRKKLNIYLDALASAQRSGNVDGVFKAKEDIEKLKNDTVQELPESIKKKELIDQINTYLSQITNELQEFTLKNEAIIKERVGDAITNDSDKDGITDYDEISLYKTNPFAADTDGDGFIDSSEITLGYNPHNSNPEALVAYQSPKETGIVREDLLTIDTLTTLTPDTPEQKTRAFISGSALPNSFVTLYVYSTPIMVTVKTRSDGSWNYIFDKELENGEHEIYLTIIDNAGSVIAKSNPLPFVKTADAFTRADAMSAALEAQNAQPSFTNKNNMIFIASVIIVSLGLVLLLIGAFTRSKKTVLKTSRTS